MHDFRTGSKVGLFALVLSSAALVAGCSGTRVFAGQNAFSVVGNPPPPPPPPKKEEPPPPPKPEPPPRVEVRDNKIEIMKRQKDGLDALSDLLRLATNNNWQEMTEDDKQRAKWYGLFFRKQTPGHFMLRLRMNAGKSNARQFRVIADLSDEFGKGFCDLTTRQQIQMRWFSLADVPEIWRRLEEVGLHSMQTGLDNVRGICGCPMAGLSQHELVDATGVIDEFNAMLVGNREVTNLPRKFNVTITGCLENCCHVETQDVGLVPAYRELEAGMSGGTPLAP